MENIEAYITQSIQLRCVEVLNHIATTNTSYRQLTGKISNLEDHLIKDLSKEQWELLDKHRDLYLQREALIADLIYQQGFIDGSGFKSIFTGGNQNEE